MIWARPVPPDPIGKQLRRTAASVGNRAPAVLRRRSGGAVSSASDDEVGGYNARDARAAQKNSLTR